jgi:two-component system cell cycle response regulator DivK
MMTPAKALSTARTADTTTSTFQTKTAPTILVIEDYSDTRELLSGVLRIKGYNVIEAEDGVAGLLIAGANCPDLIITDLALPEMDGVEAARRIHEMPKLKQTPIIVISAYLTEEVTGDLRAYGCVEVFRKPFDLDELLETIRKVIEPSDE